MRNLPLNLWMVRYTLAVLRHQGGQLFRPTRSGYRAVACGQRRLGDALPNPFPLPAINQTLDMKILRSPSWIDYGASTRPPGLVSEICWNSSRIRVRHRPGVQSLMRSEKSWDRANLFEVTSWVVETTSTRRGL
jgi:hypothetical protein